MQINFVTGALEMEVKLLLNYLIKEENVFTLNWFNQKLQDYELGYMEVTNRPTATTKKMVNSKDYSQCQSGQKFLDL